MDDARLAALLDKQEIAEIIYRVARALDRCDESLLRGCFHPDATDDHGLFTGTAEAFVPWVMKTLQSMTATSHFIGNILIETTGDIAAAESYFTAFHRLATPDGEIDMVAAGRYLDRFARRDGAWRLSHRHAVYDWTTTHPATDAGWKTSPMRELLTRGARGPADPSHGFCA
jgi:hypothetical protein